MDRMAKFILKLKWPIIILSLLITVFFGYQLTRIRVNSNVIDSLPANDSVVALFKSIGHQFGGNEVGVVIVQSDNIFKPAVLKDIQKITHTLQTVKGVAGVTSLTNILDFSAIGDNFQVKPLIDLQHLPAGKAQIDSLKQRITANKMYRNNLVAKDGTASLVVFKFADGGNDETVIKQVQQVIGKLPLKEKVYFAGGPFVTAMVSEIISEDLIFLIPITFLVISLILYLSFHSLQGVFLPLLSAGMAIVWALGCMPLLGMDLSMVTNNVPIILMAVGSAYTIHVLNRVNQCREKDYQKALHKALQHIFVPVSLAALTTMIGFVSFIFGAYLSMIRDFGVVTALGTFFAALLSLFFIPAVLSVFPAKKHPRHHVKTHKSYLNDYVLLPLTSLVQKHPRYILGFWVILILASLTGMFSIRRSVDTSDYFKKNNPERVAETIMAKEFGGTKPVFLQFTGDMQSPLVLKTMQKAQEYLQKSPFILSTQSIADIIVKLNGALSGKYTIPDNAAAIGQLWFLLDGNENLAQLVSENLDKGIVIAKFDGKGNHAAADFAKYMQPFLKKYSRPGCKIQMTGMPFIDAEMDQSLLESQIASLIIATIFVIGIVSLILWSFSKGLIASIPIAVTTIILFGTMGLTNIPLNMGTVLVASIAMGIGIDYSIHFTTHFHERIKEGMSPVEALKNTMQISGKAILINFSSVAGGFLVLIFSKLVPMQYFGILVALSMLVSSLGALTLLPVIMLSRNKNALKTV
jgi:hydrophobe/amphiphile efflux-3 (HAE3) family protein